MVGGAAKGKTGKDKKETGGRQTTLFGLPAPTSAQDKDKKAAAAAGRKKKGNGGDSQAEDSQATVIVEESQETQETQEETQMTDVVMEEDTQEVADEGERQGIWPANLYTHRGGYHFGTDGLHIGVEYQRHRHEVESQQCDLETAQLPYTDCPTFARAWICRCFARAGTICHTRGSGEVALLARIGRSGPGMRTMHLVTRTFDKGDERIL